MDSVVSRSRSNSGLHFLSLLEKSYRTPPGSDYLVTTMKLRDRVTSGRNPPRRSLKPSLKSAPPFQNRNPDNYPMQHNREDVLKSAKSRRTERQVRDKTNASTRVYSGNMRDYGKHMFDFAVVNANQNCSQNIWNTKEPSTENQPIPAKWAKPRFQQEKCKPERPDSSSTGPTPDGSILYNRRQKILNTIRIRPKSEGDGQYIHDRSTSRLSLHESILEKNQHYKVLNLNDAFHPGTTSGRSTSCSTDVLLIPMDQINETEDYFRERKFANSVNGHSVTTATDDVFSELANNESRVGTCDVYDDRDTADGRKSRDLCRLRPPTAPCHVRLVSLEEPSSSESEEEKEEAPPPPPPEPKKPEPKSPFLRKNAKVSIPEPEPEPKPVKKKLVLKGPKCWVDDATVTSEVSDEEPEEEIVEPPVPVLKGVFKGVMNMKQNLGIMSKLARSKESQAGNSKDLTKAIKGQGNTQTAKEIPKPPPEPVQPEPVIPEPVKVEEEPEVEKPICLPPFLCPSSEKKSREAAIKDWLMNSSFHSASSGVPLI